MKKIISPPFGATFLSIFFICISVALLFNACRKIDYRNDQSIKALEERFFNSHKSSEPHVQALNGFMKRRNDKDHFVERTVKQIGYPYWDKAINVTGSASQRVESDSAV